MRTAKSYAITALLALAGLSAARESTEAHAIRIVQAGDSVGSIAQRYRLPTDSVIGFNQLDGKSMPAWGVLPNRLLAYHPAFAGTR